MLNNASLRDTSLSIGARGLWALMMSRPDGWEFTVPELCKSASCGKDKIYAMLKELISKGYAYRFQCKNKVGRYDGWQTFIFEEKKTFDEIKIILPLTGFPEAENKRPVSPAKTTSPSLNNESKNTSSSLTPSGFTNEEEEYFSRRMKELPNPPRHISPAYKLKVIREWRDAQDAKARAEQDKLSGQEQYQVRRSKALDLASEAADFPARYQGKISVNETHLTMTIGDRWNVQDMFYISFIDKDFDTKFEQAKRVWRAADES